MFCRDHQMVALIRYHTMLGCQLHQTMAPGVQLLSTIDCRPTII